MKEELCDHCGRSIPPGQQAYLYQDKILCAMCDQLLRYKPKRGKSKVSSTYMLAILFCGVIITLSASVYIILNWQCLADIFDAQNIAHQDATIQTVNDPTENEQSTSVKARTKQEKSECHVATEHISRYFRETHFREERFPEYAFVGSISSITLRKNAGDFGDVTVMDDKGGQAIHYAAAGNNRELVPQLINPKNDFFQYRAGLFSPEWGKISVDAADTSGVTPLHLAVAGNSIALAEELLRHGANPNFGDKDGVTPLRLAEQAKLPEMIKLLKLHGAVVKPQPAILCGYLDYVSGVGWAGDIKTSGTFEVQGLLQDMTGRVTFVSDGLVYKLVTYADTDYVDQKTSMGFKINVGPSQRYCAEGVLRGDTFYASRLTYYHSTIGKLEFPKAIEVNSPVTGVVQSFSGKVSEILDIELLSKVIPTVSLGQNGKSLEFTIGNPGHIIVPPVKIKCDNETGWTEPVAVNVLVPQKQNSSIVDGVKTYADGTQITASWTIEQPPSTKILHQSEKEVEAELYGHKVIVCPGGGTCIGSLFSMREDASYSLSVFGNGPEIEVEVKVVYGHHSLLINGDNFGEIKENDSIRVEGGKVWVSGKVKRPLI